MASQTYSFDRFVLDPGNRRLSREGVNVELSSRYLDALLLMVREQGQLVSKDRFLGEVWRGVPVTDEALTQCIKTLRRQLGDNAGQPRFIETVPKHGYRFVAPVEAGVAPDQLARSTSAVPRRSQVMAMGLAGTAGGGLAGLVGGTIYGFAAASQPVAAGVGSLSVLLVLVLLTIALAMIGAAGVSFGIAASARDGTRSWLPATAGGALGGLLIGGLVKLLSSDGLSLLFGRSPGDVTGAAEGALLGGAVGLAAWLAAGRQDRPSLRRSALLGAVAGGAAGLMIALLGGRLMGGSLDLLAQAFPASRFRLDLLGTAFGEQGFGRLTRSVTATLEGMLFGACVVGALSLAGRRLAISPGPSGAVEPG